MQARLKPYIAGIVLLMLGSIFLIYGVHRQEHKTVEKKSNIICLECIGIG